MIFQHYFPDRTLTYFNFIIGSVKTIWNYGGSVCYWLIRGLPPICDSLHNGTPRNSTDQGVMNPGLTLHPSLQSLHFFWLARNFGQNHEDKECAFQHSAKGQLTNNLESGREFGRKFTRGARSEKTLANDLKLKEHLKVSSVHVTVQSVFLKFWKQCLGETF